MCACVRVCLCVGTCLEDEQGWGRWVCAHWRPWSRCVTLSHHSLGCGSPTPACHCHAVSVFRVWGMFPSCPRLHTARGRFLAVLPPLRPLPFAFPLFMCGFLCAAARGFLGAVGPLLVPVTPMPSCQPPVPHHCTSRPLLPFVITPSCAFSLFLLPFPLRPPPVPFPVTPLWTTRHPPTPSVAAPPCPVCL